MNCTRIDISFAVHTLSGYTLLTIQLVTRIMRCLKRTTEYVFTLATGAVNGNLASKNCKARLAM